METNSDFGMGLTYCLGLFLCHCERRDDGLNAESWFNGASDHLYDVQIPDNMPPILKDRLTNLKDRALHWGHAFREPRATQKDREWAIQEAKALLIEIDRHFGVEVCEATWA